MRYRTYERVVSLLGLITSASVIAPRPGAAQQRVKAEITRTPGGEVLDFHADGAWRREGRRVSAYRRSLLERGDFATLNAPLAGGVPLPTPAAVSGTKRIPAILFRFFDVGTGVSNDTSQYSALLFGNAAPAGKPYSIKTFYRELSNTLLTLDGTVIGWIQLDNPETQYTGGTNCAGQNPYGGLQCNGIWSSAAISARIAGLNEALGKSDPTVDFSQFDNDGPDGLPNSGDDDGYVDLVYFIHSELDGACFSTANGHLWSHKGSGLNFATNDLSGKAAFGNIRIRDYTLQSGVGGSGSIPCTTLQIMPIGTAAHETGHAFGLPDLYDISGATQGIGQWGLMGSGNYSSASSPTRMEAWSLNELGWVAVRPLTVNGTYAFGPAPTSDTAFVVRVQGTNTRKEYYLLENRQAVQADSAMIRLHCGESGFLYPTNCAGGLAVWHADSTKLQQGRFSNSVNVGTPQGLLLVQSDGRADLQKTGSNNRGDAGDLWPGTCTGPTGPQACGTRYSFNTNPRAVTNADTTVFIGFQIDSIRQLVPDGAMSFRLLFGQPTIVRASDTLAKVQVDGIPYNRFAGLFDDGSTHTIAVDSAQTPTDGKTQYVFQSWSDGGARSHTVAGTFAGATYTATVSTRYKLQAAVSGTGTVASTPPVDHTTGVFLDKNTAETLAATAGSGNVFERWTGDTNTTGNPLVLTMTKPYVVTANFVGQLAATSGALPGPVMGKPYAFTLTASGGVGGYSWQQTGGAFPQGLSLNSQGLISGTPEVSGSFTATVRVASGSQTLDLALNFTVTEPALTLAKVLPALLGTTPAVSTDTLSIDDIKYLDLIGNNTCVSSSAARSCYDVGDFLAWVNKSNISPVSPAVLQAVAGVEEWRVKP